MGGCLKQADWFNQFKTVKAWDFDSVRLYSSASCDTIMRAAPAAIQPNITLLAGIWAVSDDNYASEKAAFLKAVQTYGTSYLAAVSVGSDSLYRKEIDPDLLATRIKDVKSNPLNGQVLRQSDSLGTVADVERFGVSLGLECHTNLNVSEEHQPETSQI